MGTPVRAVDVLTPSRLHLGMLSFGDPETRSFGGVGVMIDRPPIHVRLRRSGSFVARGPLAERAAQFARDCAAAWGLAADAAAEIEVVAAPRAHVGLGSGTQLALAVAAGMRRLWCLPGPAQGGEHTVSPAEVIELARAVGRGRRSCVGIHGFSRGGLVVEAGRHVASPASIDEPGLSPLVAHVSLPASWRCVVIIERHAVGLHGDAEKAAFRSLAPVPRDVSAELARIALLELVPAALEGRFAEFSRAVSRYGALAGQPFEPASRMLPHAASMARLIERLRELGVVGVAQSSWGPAVMACCESLGMAESLVRRLDATGFGHRYEPMIARFDSRGAVLRESE